MNKSQFLEKIDALPEILQNQVFDYVDFLFQKHFPPGGKEEAFELTVEEKEELDNRYSSYKVNPKAAIGLVELKSKLMEK